MTDASREEYRLVQDKKAEMQPLFDRMDKDEQLYLLKPYKMMGLPPYDNKEMPEVANVTLNDPLLYANKAVAIIAGASRQTVIEGEGLTDKETAKIEQFVDDISYIVNEWLVKRGIVSLDGFINEQICLRGRIPARSCMRLGDNGLIPDVLPIDARRFVYESGPDGMEWGAGIYTRSKSHIQREYEIEIGGKTGEVTDFWNSEENVVFVDGRVAREQQNIYGEPPFVVSVCPIGCMFGTQDALEHEGESIFWANRNLWEEKNRTATILQTLNVQSLFANLQYESSEGENAAKRESPYGHRKVLPVEKGMGFRAMPTSDIKRAATHFYSMVETCLQRGSLATVDYGTLTFPLSAIALQTLTSSRDDIFLPRIQAIAMFYQALSRMIIKQCRSLGKTIQLGGPGTQNTYHPSDFDGEYSINYKFYTDSKEQRIANLSTASAAQPFLCGDTIRREILGLQNPDEEETKYLSEQAEKVDEVLFLYRRAVKLIEEEKPIEAYILASRIVTILKQRQMESALVSGQGKVEGSRTQQPEAQGRPAGEPALPLLGGGGRATGARTPTPQEEVTSD